MLKFKKEVNFYYQEVQKPEEVEIEAITLYGSRENRFTQKRRGFHKDDRAKSHITIGKLDDYEEDDSDDEKEQQLKKIIKDYNIDMIIINKDYTPYSIKRDKNIEKLCKELNICEQTYAFEIQLIDLIKLQN